MKLLKSSVVAMSLMLGAVQVAEAQRLPRPERPDRPTRPGPGYGDGPGYGYGNQKRIIIEMYDKEFRAGRPFGPGRGGMGPGRGGPGGMGPMGGAELKLKMLAKQQNPYLDLRDLKLEEVILVAKSRMGMGNASLIVGGVKGYEQNIPGHPQDFYDNGRYTYTRVKLENPNYRDQSQGVWQIDLKGNIKVKRIILKVKEKRRGGGGHGGPGRVYFQELGSFKADKFENVTREYFVGRRLAVKAIKLEAQRRDVEVRDVKAVLASGQVMNLRQLEGNIDNGEDKVMYFRSPQYVRSIIVTATTDHFRGGSGILTVSAGS